MSNIGKNSTASKIYPVIIVILVSALVWFFIENQKLNKTRNEMLVELEQKTEEKTAAVSELSDMLVQYDNLETTNDTLNERLVVERERIEELIVEIKNTKASNSRRMKELEKEVGTLREIMRSYVVQIDSLHQLNVELIAENKNVKYEYSLVMDENENLENRNDSLQGTVEKAQALKALNIDASGLNTRGKSTEHISKLDKIKVCCALSENSLTPTGKQYIYIRISDQSGQILTHSVDNLFDYKGEQIAFSDRRMINYKGKSQSVCVYWTRNEMPLAPGTYAVDIFFQGNMIGTKSFVLR